MKHRLIEKIADGLSSGRLRTVGRRAAGRLFALTLFGLVAAAAAPVTAMAALETQESAPEDVGGGAGADGNEVKLEYTVNEITGGDAYDDMMKQMESDGRSDNVKVYQLTATAVGEDGEAVEGEVNLLDCKVKVQMNQEPQEWWDLFFEKYAENGVSKTKVKEGLLSVTIKAEDGKEMEKLIASGDVDEYVTLMEKRSAGEPLNSEEESNLAQIRDWMTVEAEFNVGDNNSVVFAVKVESIDDLTLTSNTPFLRYIDVPAGRSMTIDLNGYTWVRPDGYKSVFPLVYVHSGGSLKVIDSGKPSKVNISGAQCIFAITDDNGDIEPGEINIECRDDTVFNNEGGNYIIFAQETVKWGGGCGTVKLSGGTLRGANSYSWQGGGISVALGTVEMSGGIIENNAALLGGGIYANKVKMTGGTIRNNKSTGQEDGGGGVWAAEMEMNGGMIENNKSSHEGGGVWAARMELYSGKIQQNNADYAGGGVYAKSMLMTGGEINANNVVNNGNSAIHPRGGAGIYIAADRSDKESGIIHEANGVSFNMYVTGGSIINNISANAGGGIFVDVDAVAYISGTQGRIVRIEGNQARDELYEGKTTKHGFVGGGIFVEHPDNAPNGNGRDAGKVYIYNAVITENKAEYGGGVAGCGTSTVDVCSVDGVAIYGNTSTGKANVINPDLDYKAKSNDLYTDGKGKVDSMMMGSIQGSWSGVKAKNDNATKDEKDYEKVDKYSSGYQEFNHGFYLTADPDGELTETQKNEIENLVTVSIKGNHSATGGGGVGGNGFINMGFTVPQPNSSLTLEKIVNSPEEAGKKFRFNIKFYEDDKKTKPKGDLVFEKKVDDKLETGNIGSSESDLDTGEYKGIDVILGTGDYYTVKSIPSGTYYEITEVFEKEEEKDKYMTSFKVKFGKTEDNTDESEEDENGTTDNNKVVWTEGDPVEGYDTTGSISTDTKVEFTNTAVYALPSTGGPGLKSYTMAGALCFMFGAGLMYRKKFRGRRV